MTFRIQYVHPRPDRVVGAAHFAGSIVGVHLARLAIGKSTAKFWSAGYAKITRIT